MSDSMWSKLREEATSLASRERILSKILTELILERESLSDALSWRLSSRLAKGSVPENDLRGLFRRALNLPRKLWMRSKQTFLQSGIGIRRAMISSAPFCISKGFQALCSYRVGHALWNADRREIALYLQSLTSIVYSVDIHPAARIGKGIMLDHATGFVAGETTVIENDVSILHEVTLGGTGKERGIVIRKSARSPDRSGSQDSR